MRMVGFAKGMSHVFMVMIGVGFGVSPVDPDVARFYIRVKPLLA